MVPAAQSRDCTTIPLSTSPTGTPELTPHGRVKNCRQNAREFALMVEAGMTSADAIKAATANAAELLDIADIAGSLAPGKSADIIAVDGDPLADVTELERVTFVMAQGVRETIEGVSLLPREAMNEVRRKRLFTESGNFAQTERAEILRPDRGRRSSP